MGRDYTFAVSGLRRREHATRRLRSRFWRGLPPLPKILKLAGSARVMLARIEKLYRFSTTIKAVRCLGWFDSAVRWTSAAWGPHVVGAVLLASQPAASTAAASLPLSLLAEFELRARLLNLSAQILSSTPEV